MEDAYGIGITNRYDFLVDTDTNDLQAILKQKAKKAKKAAKKLAGKENAENSNGKVEIKVIDEKKVKFVVPGKGGPKQTEPAQQPAQKSRSMKDTQNIQSEGNTENGMERTREPRNNFDRERNYGNNRNNENRENREQRFNRRNKDGGSNTNDGNQSSQENGSGPPNRGYRTNNGYRNNDYKGNDYRGNENNSNSNNGQDIEYNNQRDQRDRDNDRPARRQGNDRNFGNRDGNRRNDGQRRNFDGRGGKREFDRQSGSDKTGVKAVEKREGGGAHNWGTHKQDIEDLDKNVTDAENKDDGNSVENTKSEENLVVEVEPQLYTYDEYLQRKTERAKPVYNLRKAGEGEDKKKWKNMVPLQKTKEDVKSEDEYEFDPAQYPQRKRGLKVVTDIRVCFNEGKRIGNFNNNNDRRRRRPPRDSDGRQRNGEDKRQNAPQVDDPRLFPSLG